jgi:hypothetical protein
MPNLQQQIADKFLQALAEHEGVDAHKVDELRALLIRGKKAKADDFVRIFVTPPGGEVK